jgi:hypothetical protein
MQRIVALLPEGKLSDAVLEKGLAPAAAEAGAEIVRVKAEFSSANELGAVCGEIEKADLCVAELTGKNPNVMYQVGYAHALGKKVLMLSRHGEDFPFDKTRHAVIVYEGEIDFLKGEFLNWLKTGTVARPDAEAAESTGAAAGEARQIFESTFGDILAKHGHVHRGDVQLENPSTFVLIGQDMDLALVQDLARRARELGLRLKLM